MLVLGLLCSLALADAAHAGPLGGSLTDSSEGAAPPLAQATLAPDGSYDLLVQPPRGWQEAEITVSGDGAHDVGAVGLDERLRLAGVTESRGRLEVMVQAVDEDDRGITWVFTVDPELVPLASPGPGGADEARRRGFFQVFGGRQGSEG